MKLQFGTSLSRMLRGGVRLSPLEEQLLAALVERLPQSLRHTVEAQFESYNLAQREVDGRALNFYRKGKAVADYPRIEHKGQEAHLIRISAEVSNEEPIHAVLTAVDGRAFCISFSRSLSGKEIGKTIRVTNAVQAWRSNTHVQSAA